MICKECNHSNEGAGKFCAECGAPLAAPAPPLTCSTCGAQYPAGTKFCPEDGTKLALPPTGKHFSTTPQKKSKNGLIFGCIILFIVVIAGSITLKKCADTKQNTQDEMRRLKVEKNTKLVQYSAIACSEVLAGKINGVASVIRAYSGLIENIITSSSIAQEHKREYIIQDLVGILQREKSVTNIFCLFEPNVVDGLDYLFKGKRGCSADGRFIPYVTAGRRISTASLDVIESPLYYFPLDTGREIISEPYTVIENGVQTQIFSVSIPIMVEGKFVGVIGSRFSIDELSRMISDINNYGDVKLVTDKGVIAVCHDYERIGSLAEGGNREILKRLPEGRMFEGFYELDGKKQYKVYVPIQLGEGNKPWFFAIDVPADDIYR